MALITDLTLTRGAKDTADNISEEKPLEISDTIWMHEPNRTKALAWAMRTGTKVPTSQHKFGHLEAAPHAIWVEYAGSNEVTQATGGIALKTDQGARVTIGSRIRWMRTGEIMRLTEAMSTDTSADVERNFGNGTTASLLQTGDKGLILTPAFEQGFTTGLGLSSNMVMKNFATSEISYPIQTTFVENAESHRGGSPFIRALRMAITQSKKQMEAELILGGQVINDSFSLGAAHPISAARGIDEFIVTNRYTAASLSRMDFWDILAEWKAQNHEGGAIWCSMQFKAMVAGWALGHMVQDQESKKDGLNIDIVKTPFGEFDLVDIDLFNQEPNLMGSVYLVPNRRIQYRPLIHFEDLDIRTRKINRDEIHSKESEIYGVYGWEYFEEEMWSAITGLQFSA